MGGPYPSTAAGLGGLPTVIPDIPICAVLIAVYISFGVTNRTIFMNNRHKHHPFWPSLFLFGFTMARMGTLVLRIAWTTRPHNIRLAIAAHIFVNTGILVIYVINLFLSSRILRAAQPRLGWNPILRTTYKILYALIGVALIMVITSVVLSLYTLDPHTHTVCRAIQLAALTYLLIFTCLPLLQLALATFLPRTSPIDPFGHGTLKSKILTITASSSLCVVIAGFKAGVNWSPPRPATHPPWYDSKACFYIFNFTCEILVLCVLTFSRIDRQFYIPKGSKGPGDYSKKLVEERGILEEDNRVEALTTEDVEKT